MTENTEGNEIVEQEEKPEEPQNEEEKKPTEEEESSQCEHELIATDEYWITVNCVRVDMECQKCKTKFEGVLYEQ